MFELHHSAFRYKHTSGTKFYELIRINFVGKAAPGPGNAEIAGRAAVIIKRWGKIDAVGQTQILWAGSPHEANSMWDKLRRERTARRTDGRYEQTNEIAHIIVSQDELSRLSEMLRFNGFEWKRADTTGLYSKLGTMFVSEKPEPFEDGIVDGYEEFKGDYGLDDDDIINEIVAEVGDGEKEITSTYGDW